MNPTRMRSFTKGSLFKNCQKFKRATRLLIIDIQKYECECSVTEYTQGYLDATCNKCFSFHVNHMNHPFRH